MGTTNMGKSRSFSIAVVYFTQDWIKGPLSTC